MEKILRNHFTNIFEDNLDEDIDYLCVRIFDVIQELGGLNGLVGELINNTEWDYHTEKFLKDKYL